MYRGVHLVAPINILSLASMSAPAAWCKGVAPSSSLAFFSALTDYPLAHSSANLWSPRINEAALYAVSCTWMELFSSNFWLYGAEDLE